MNIDEKGARWAYHLGQRDKEMFPKQKPEKVCPFTTESQHIRYWYMGFQKKEYVWKS